jgi:hypothetical protein
MFNNHNLIKGGKKRLRSYTNFVEINQSDKHV